MEQRRSCMRSSLCPTLHFPDHLLLDSGKFGNNYVKIPEHTWVFTESPNEVKINFPG